ncbi:MAG: FtsX-like permease family protein [Balneolaceae bacterium]|nr:MAG: FtsX-like permease family protein [Balneolaceae bacterium]
MSSFLKAFLNPFTRKLAWRDAKPQWKSLLLYTSSVIAGVAALVAILSFRNDVLLTVDDQARELLGADIELRATQPFHEEAIAFIDSVGGSDAEAVEFNSMVFFGNSGVSRLAQVRAVDGPFPLYGSIKTNPAEAAGNYQQFRQALVEQSAMRQFGISTGDTIRVGDIEFQIAGELISVPGEAAAFSLIGPRVYIPKSSLEGSALLQRGSRVTYKEYFKLAGGGSVSDFTEQFRPIAREHRIRIETVESRKQDFEAIVDNLTKFLGLIGFVALLLGGLGVGSAIYVYIRRKTSMVATLRCLGVSREIILAAFSIQIAVLGLIGAVAGTAAGLLMQNYLPLLFSDLLPIEIVQGISFQAIALGLFTGVAISVAFSLLPLAAISTISPLLTIRSGDFSPFAALGFRVKILTASFALAVTVLVITLLTESYTVSFIFTASLIIFIYILWAVAALLMKAVRRLRLSALPYVIRQGMANLFRPNNQTGMLMTTLGMGMLLIGTLYLSQDMITQRINIQLGDDTPDLVFYDIQSDQNEGLLQTVSESGGTVLQNVPIVSMRLSARNGATVSEMRADSTLQLSGWALTREYRVTYRDFLTESETITEGEWIPYSDGFDSVVPISVSPQIMDELRLSLGDTLEFNVQGVPLSTVVASVREVDFSRPEPNFFVLFPAGVLEPAPQFFAATVNASGPEEALAIQQAVVSAYPNISAIDISIALGSVREFLDQIALAVQFMALFSILTGFIVLSGSITISRRQRTRESVLLRTLGALKSQVGSIQTVEYALLGFLSSLTGLLLALIASWGLAFFYFDIAFFPDFLNLAGITLLIMAAAIAIGWSGSRHIFRHSPLEILRQEVN